MSRTSYVPALPGNDSGTLDSSALNHREHGQVTNSWEDVIEAWCEALRAGGVPSTTMRTRREHVQRCARAGGWSSPEAVTGEGLVRWFSRQTWAPETRRSHRNTHRAFWAWMIRTGRREDNPADALPKVKATAGVPRPVDEIAYSRAVHDAAPRVRLILRCAAEVGLRRAEIAQIHRRDLIQDLGGYSLIVHGKGDRPRVVPLPGGLASLIREQVERWGYMLPGDDAGHLSPRYVGKLATRVLPDDWTLHSLRHRFATRAYQLDRDVFTVQQLLGHASPATTRRYVALDTSGMRSTVERVAA